MIGPAPLIVVCGLNAEAKIARGRSDGAPGLTVLSGGGDSRRLASDLDEMPPQTQGILSFGVAGGLAPGLSPGDILVAEAIVAPDGRRFPSDPAWTSAIAARLYAPRAIFATVDAPLADIAGKAALRQKTMASTVDMESHIAARAAARKGVRLAAIRVVTDPAHRALPHAATVGMRPDGAIDVLAILKSLAARPGQLPALVRTGRDARAAFASLLRCRQTLGPGFALLDL